MGGCPQGRMVIEEVVMAKIRRNEPCPCGSTKKAKRCCFSVERLAETAEVRRAFEALCKQVAPALRDVERVEFDELFRQAIHLPEIDLSVQVSLPALSSPAVEQARASLAADDTDTFDAAVWEIAEELGTPQRRLALAHAIIALRDAGRIDSKVAAAATFDLAGGTSSAVFISSVAESIAVSAGDTHTPAGLIIVAA